MKYFYTCLLLSILACKAKLPSDLSHQDSIPTHQKDSVVKTISQSTNEKSFKDSIFILSTGSFHGDEVPENASGKTWLGIFRDEKGYYLKKTKVSITKVMDGLLDEEGEMTGIEVSSSEADPVFLISGLFPIHEGRIKDPEGSYIIKEAGNKDNFQFEVSAVKKGRKLSQKIGNGQTEIRPDLLWAGDIDRDGLPDFLINLSDHENVSDLTLWLSSKADEDKLIKLVARFMTVGC
jgi:hypothetical protein